MNSERGVRRSVGDDCPNRYCDAELESAEKEKETNNRPVAYLSCPDCGWNNFTLMAKYIGDVDYGEFD